MAEEEFSDDELLVLEVTDADDENDNPPDEAEAIDVDAIPLSDDQTGRMGQSHME